MAAPLWAAPADIASIPAPMLGSDPPKAKDIRDGDASVSTQTGALSYAFPISVPPGRMGLQPNLALSYSSQGAVYGGVANNWSLSLPEIRLDVTESVLDMTYFGGVTGQQPAWQREKYITTLSGSRPLIPVTEPAGAAADVLQAYRAQNDDSYTRYERVVGAAFEWRARGTNGQTYYFGETALVTDPAQYVIPLTSTEDRFGNRLEYKWVGQQISEIRYTSNPSAGLPAFAKVEFDYQDEFCAPGVRLPIGAAEDGRLGVVEGRRKLTKIRAIALDDAGTTKHTREYTLGYDALAAQCNKLHGPQRVLTSIQESAWQAGQPPTALPAVTFGYNRIERAFDDTRTQLIPWLPEPNNDKHGTASGERWGGEAWNGVRTMMLDFDGDGLPDRLELIEDVSDPNECKFSWSRNLGRYGGSGSVDFDAPSAPILMPRLPWKNGTKGQGEACFLNHQVTTVTMQGMNSGCIEFKGTHLAYRWLDLDANGRVDLVAAIHQDSHFDASRLVNPATGQVEFPDLFTRLKLSGSAWPLCLSPLPDGGRCLGLDRNCLQSSVICTKPPCTVPADDLLACVAAAPRVECGRMEKGVRWDCSINPSCPTAPADPIPTGGDCGHVRPHDECDRYPWMIYWNTGGNLATTGVVKYQPVPLESENGDSPSGGGGAVFSQSHAVTDIDSDGYVDLVMRGADYSTDYASPFWWFVFRGDGQGNFHGFQGGDPYVWLVPYGAVVSGGCEFKNGPQECSSSGALMTHDDTDLRGHVSLVDLNGDGASDYVWSYRHTNPWTTWFEADGFFNNGRQLGNNAATHVDGNDLLGQFDLASRAYVHPTNYDPQAHYMFEGWKYGLDRFLDLDGDGRVDMVRGDGGAMTTTDPQLTRVHMNVGGSFMAPEPLPTAGNEVRAALVQKSLALSLRRWSVVRDFIDMDGDGIPEHWNFETPNQATVIREKDNQPLRLLQSVSNGRGATVTVTYAAVTDPSVVTQDPTQGTASLRKAVPSSQWVVKSLSTYDQWDPDISTTSYKYTHPIWGKDDRGRWGFRGFEEVTTTLPPAPAGSAKVVDTYDYAVDWSGRLLMSRKYAAEMNPGGVLTNPSTVSQTTWSPYTLFNNKLKTYHAYEQQSWTCSNGQAEAACRAAFAGYVKKLSIWEALSGQAWAETNTYTMDGPSYAAGDRRTYQGFTMHSTPTAYQIQQHSGASFLSTNGNTTQDTWTSYSETYFDAAYKQATSQSQFFDMNNGTGLPDYGTRAVTSWTYDPATGVKLTTRNPRHFPAGPVETLDYDSTKRFVIASTNELGQIVAAAYEPGTGAQLWKQGPNGTAPNIEQVWTDVDGLGRPVASYVNRNPGSGSWVKTKVSRTEYLDTFTPTTRTKVVAESLIDYGGARWTKEETELDGKGRFDRVTSFTGAATNAITTYDYDRADRLVSVTLPDPSQDTGATVTYTYAYDSLGRATSMRRPAVGGAAASGVDMAYNGLTQQSDEVVGSLGGPSARKVLVNDNFGRLVEVREYTGASTYASTYYQYDGGDRITRIQNPDNVVTQLIHDLGGRRTRIDRAGRTWNYTYRTDGQLQTETVPGVAGTTTNTFAYDPLGRMSSRIVGTRGLSGGPGGDQEVLGIGQTTFSYDGCTNGVGRLCTVTLPGNVVITAYAYDSEGNTTDTTRTLKFGGLTTAWSRTTRATFGPGGKVVDQLYADQANGQTAVTKSTFTYDERGNPKALTWTPATGSAARPVASQTRNIAGLVTLRQAALAGVLGTTGWKNFTSAFTYDALTRVASQTVTNVNASGITTQHAKQQLDYYGSDDPARLRQWMGTTAYDFTFGYDQLHELTTVSEANGKYSATFAYGVLNGSTPSGSGKFRSATVGGTPQSGGQVAARNVTYAYGAADPEAPSALMNASSGTPLRSYVYDPAGNQTAVHPGFIASPPRPTYSFAYDGDDQLRRATQFTAGTTTVIGTEEYFYDHSGQRVGVVTRNAQGVVTKIRAFLGDTEVELSAAGAVTQAFAYLSLGTPVAKVVSPSGGWTSTATTWANSPSSLELQYHGLSSNTLLSVRPDGAVQAGFVYAPYGDVVQTTGATSTTIAGQRRRFNDKFRDDLTSLTYYGVRYYDSLALTWTQADPMYRFVPDAAWTEPRRAGLYTFVLGNPVRYVDPDGRDSVGDALNWTSAAVSSVGVKRIGIGYVASCVPVAAVLSMVVMMPSDQASPGPKEVPLMIGIATATPMGAAMATMIKGKATTQTDSKTTTDVTDVPAPSPGGPPSDCSVPNPADVTDSKLRNRVVSYTKGVDSPTRQGDGTTAAAIRHEISTGEKVGGKTHSIKGQELINGLSKDLRSGRLTPGEKCIAEKILKELSDALATKPPPA